MNVLFSLAEIKFIQSNQDVFKNFVINQSESSIIYKELFIFFDINQSESSFNCYGKFSKFDVNQSELSSTSCIFQQFGYQTIQHSFTGNICGKNQSESSLHRFKNVL